ncbi:MAG: hypothetical protein HWE20_04250 [Gammaproteobacteria bacterium]|nr:hypothetical protein [Gammaproteobacteria bacterium]
MKKGFLRWLRNKPATDAGHVYYVKLKTSHGLFYKLGFTQKESIEEWFADEADGTVSLEKVFAFGYRPDAFMVVRRLQKYFRKELAYGKGSRDPMLPLCGTGQCELYRGDVLGLDNDLYLKSDEILKTAADNDAGGCLVITAILVGVVGVPLGGWGIPVLIGVGIWYFFFSSKETEAEIIKQNAQKRPVHPAKIQNLVDNITSSVPLTLRKIE